jgi:hypothetical protein
MTDAAVTEKVVITLTKETVTTTFAVTVTVDPVVSSGQPAADAEKEKYETVVSIENTVTIQSV